VEAKYVIVYTDGIEFDEAFDGPENVEHYGLHYIWREVIESIYVQKGWQNYAADLLFSA